MDENFLNRVFANTEHYTKILAAVAKYGSANEEELRAVANKFPKRLCNDFDLEMEALIKAGYVREVNHERAGKGWELTEDGALHLAVEHEMDWALDHRRIH